MKYDLLHAFSRKWNLQQYSASLPKEREGHLVEGRGALGSKLTKLADEAIASSFFWAYAQMILELSAPADILSRWCETCFYHNIKCSEPTCVYKGAKAADLACGFHNWLLKEYQDRTNRFITAIIPQLSPDDAQTLRSDWLSGKARFDLEYSLKLHHWSLFPWKLCSVSANALDVARAMGRDCQKDWNKLTAKQKRAQHPMTRRFLDPEWKGQVTRWMVGSGKLENNQTHKTIVITSVVKLEVRGGSSTHAT